MTRPNTLTSSWLRIGSRVGVAVLIAACFKGCAGTAAGPVSGQVLESGTNRPIAGAWLSVRWRGGGGSMFGHSSSWDVHNEHTVSGRDGRYETKAWRDLNSDASLDDTIRLDAYAPGYERAADDLQDLNRTARGDYRIFLTASSKSRRERLEDLLLLYRANRGSKFIDGRWQEVVEELPRGPQGMSGGYGPQALPMYRAIVSEMNSLAVTAEEKKHVHDYKHLAASHILRTGPMPGPYAFSAEDAPLLEKYVKEHLE